MDTLLIAPPSELAYRDAEIQTVVNLLDAKVLIGEGCTVNNVLLKLTEKDFDLIWYAGHGVNRGFILRDEEMLTSDVLIQHLRGKDTAFFLNTCVSLSVAMELNEALKCSVIATVSEVEDIVAYRTGTLMASCLARGESLADSYENSRPGGNIQYILLQGLNAIKATRHERLDEILRMIYQLSRKIDDVKAKVTYNEVRFWEIMEDRDEIAEDRFNIRFTAGMRNQVIFGAFLALANLIFVYSDIRQRLGVTAFDALIVALITIPLGGYLMLTGLGFSFGKKKAD